MFAITESHRDGYTISTDPARLDIEAIHAYLTTSYWSRGIPRATVERSLKGSLCFGMFDAAGHQVGLTRVITDGAIFAYMCDVYILDAHRGRGLGMWMMEVVLAHPDLQGLRRFLLATRDAHALYAKLGFSPIAHPQNFMDIHRPDVYLPHPAE